MKRRDFLKTGAVVGAGALTVGLSQNFVFGAGDEIKIGLIGCGKRGVEAAQQCVKAGAGVSVVAVADPFQTNLDAAKGALKAAKASPGMDGCKQVLADGQVNLVILATPPAFHPQLIADAIAAGKNVFVEAPVAICMAGTKMVAEAAAQAEGKKLALMAGFQNRYDPAIVETMKRVNDGAIGPVLAAQCFLNKGNLPALKRKPGEKDLEWQLRNWRCFVWLGGETIVNEQVHQIDLINWAFGAPPDSLRGQGGRVANKSEEYGNVYDHMGVEMWYPGKNRHVICMNRLIDGTQERTEVRIAGVKGVATPGKIEGEAKWEYTGAKADPYAQEQTDLIKSIRAGAPINNGKQAAESTLTAVMAREAGITRNEFKRSFFEAKITQSLLPPAGLKLDAAKPVDPVLLAGKYNPPGWPGGGGKRR